LLQPAAAALCGQCPNDQTTASDDKKEEGEADDWQPYFSLSSLGAGSYRADTIAALATS